MLYERANLDLELQLCKAAVLCKFNSLCAMRYNVMERQISESVHIEGRPFVDRVRVIYAELVLNNLSNTVHVIRKVCDYTQAGDVCNVGQGRVAPFGFT